MMNSEKTTRIHLLDRTLTYFNQGCPHWTHPYAWQGEGTLTDSGCGIFSLCHCIEWLTRRSAVAGALGRLLLRVRRTGGRRHRSPRAASWADGQRRGGKARFPLR